MRARRIYPALVVLFLILAATLMGQEKTRDAGGPPKPEGTNVWDGVYTAAQAARGESAFTDYCGSCHRGNLRGETFMGHWREDKLVSLFDFIRTNMPEGNPGIASESEYIDIVAWLLSINGFPAGHAELTPAQAANIQVIGKNGAAAVPDGSLVLVVGCLVQGPDNSWMLTQASEPVRTRDVDPSTPEELKESGARPLGTSTFGLPAVDFYKPGPQKGHKVEAKGFLDRETKGDRILVNTLQTVAPNCP